jgi:DNA-binding PadR family transcriptional regulator
MFAKELIKGSTKTLILSVLIDGEKYGYQIIKAIRAKSSEKLQFGEGSIYPALHALEKSGDIVSRWEKQESLPDRKYYKITPQGQSNLKSLLEEWHEFVDTVGQVYREGDSVVAKAITT